jgi:hypothetical protein
MVASEAPPAPELREDQAGFDPTGFAGDRPAARPKADDPRREAADLIADYGPEEAYAVVARQLEDARRMGDDARAAWLATMLALIGNANG